MFDSERFSGLVLAVGQAGLRPDAWPAALGALSRAFSGALTGIGVLDSAAPDVARALPGSGRLHGAPAGPALAPMWRFLRCAPVGEPFTNESVPAAAPGGEDVRCMAAPVFRDTPESGGRMGWVAVARRCPADRPFDARDAGLLKLLLPHIELALRATLRLSELELGRAAMLAALDRAGQAVVAAAEDGRVLAATRTAERALAAPGGLHLRAGRLAAARADDTAALRRLLAQAASGGPGGSFTPGRAEGTVTVAAGPDGAPSCALVFLDAGSDRDASSVQARYGLTPAELLVALEVGRGQGTKAAARALGLSPATVRWHLQRVFEKTGTHRQAELARLLPPGR